MDFFLQNHHHVVLLLRNSCTAVIKKPLRVPMFCDACMVGVGFFLHEEFAHEVDFQSYPNTHHVVDPQVSGTLEVHQFPDGSFKDNDADCSEC